MDIQTPHLDLHIDDAQKALLAEGDNERKLQLVVAAMEIVAEFYSYGFPQEKILEIVIKSWSNDIPADILSEIVAMVFEAYESEGGELQHDGT
jgi:hypothetical protein